MVGRLPLEVLVIIPLVHERTFIPFGVGNSSVNGKDTSTMLVEAPVSTMMSIGSSPAKSAYWLLVARGAVWFCKVGATRL